MAAIRTLGGLLEQEEASRLTHSQEESVLATVLLLVFHDVSRICAALKDCYTDKKYRYAKQVSPLVEPT